jgi:hypothetical protein
MQLQVRSKTRGEGNEANFLPLSPTDEQRASREIDVFCP